MPFSQDIINGNNDDNDDKMNGSAPTCIFVEAGRGRRIAVAEYFKEQIEGSSSLCRPIVVDTCGHYNVALPLVLDGEDPVLLVLESMANPVCQQHENLAGAFVKSKKTT